MLIGRDKKPKPRPRLSVRKLFEGTIAQDGDFADLTVKKGAHRTVVDKEGDVVSSNYDPGCVIWASIGDRLVLTGPTIDEIASVEVITMRPDTTMRVAFRYGKLAEETKSVRVLLARGNR
jgi:hypothetical protein